MGNDDLYETIDLLREKLRKLEKRVQDLENQPQIMLNNRAADLVSEVIAKAMEHYAVPVSGG